MKWNIASIVLWNLEFPDLHIIQSRLNMTDFLTHEALHHEYGPESGQRDLLSPWHVMVVVAMLMLMSCLAFLAIRLSMVLPVFHPRGRGPALPSPARTMVIWGSGGHTTEMMMLLQALFPSSSKYAFHCVVAHSDSTTRSKIDTNPIVKQLLQDASWHVIQRSREVKQSWLTTVWTTAISVLQSLVFVLQVRPQLIVCNGPGTCVPLCYAAFFWNLVGISNTKLVFVESFCRVEKLSLTGKLLYGIADRFVLQWPHLLNQYPRAEYLGDLHQQDPR